MAKVWILAPFLGANMKIIERSGINIPYLIIKILTLPLFAYIFCIFNTVEECQIKMTLEYIISLQIFMKAVLEFNRSFKKSFDPTYYNGCFWNFCPKSIWVVKSCLGIWFLHATGVLRDQGSKKKIKKYAILIYLILTTTSPKDL